uniref:Uncharacterized protein n=1 Tax=uncultured Desulfobacterium sp. TaxID=201089 RepID=E1YGT7_9BACT|nr:unknown protein [uncultured Desulfobacterium sp.]
MINKITNNWPIVLAQKTDMSVMQNCYGPGISAQSQNDEIILEKKISHPVVHTYEKGTLINIYA